LKDKVQGKGYGQDASLVKGFGLGYFS